MRRFVNKYKLWVILVLLVVCCVGGILIFNSSINGRLINYHKDDNNYIDGYLFDDQEIADYFYECCINDFNMEQEVVDEMFKYQEKYTAYWIEIEIKNDAILKIYDINLKLGTDLKNIWLDTTSLCECQLDLEAGEKYTGSVAIIIRTENMTDDEIEKLIKGVGITISANLVDDLSIVTSKTIYFNK